MKLFNYSLFLFLTLYALQVQGEETITLQGRISADGNTPDKVWIGAFGTPVRPRAEALSWNEVDSQEFELVIPQLDEIQLVVLSQGFLPSVHTVQTSSSSEQFELQLKKGVTLEGTVISTDMVPIPDAVLSLERRDLPNVRIPDQLVFSWISNVDGVFKISGLAPSNRYMVEVELPDSYVENENFSVEISQNEIQSRDLRLSNAYFVLGRVVDPDQESVLDATVRAQSTSDRRRGEFWRITTTSDSDGEFQLGPFVRGLEMWLSATHENWGTSQRIRTKSGVHDVDLVLENLVHVVGTVTDESTGKLIDDFTLKAITEEASRDYPHTGVKGEISSYVDRQTTGLIVDSEEHTAYFKLDVELESLEEYDMGVIALERGRRLTGKVYDESSGQPIADVRVELEEFGGDEFEADHFWLSFKRRYLRSTVNSTTDEDGRYELGPLPSHSTRISVFEFGYLPIDLKVDAGVTQLDIPLKQDGALKTRIKGKIITSSGEPGQGMVHFQTENSSSSYGVFGGGTFDHMLVAGDYDVYATSDQGRSDKVRVSLAEGEVREVTLVINSDGRLTGIIEGLADGETASLSITPESALMSSKDVYGVENGEFVVEGIGFGVFDLIATTSKNREQQKSFEVSEATGEARLELYFTGQSRLYGSLRLEDGSVPTAGKVLAIAKQDGKTSGSCEINDDGTIEINGLEDGEYRIVLVETLQITFNLVNGGSSSTQTTQEIEDVDVVIRGDTEIDIQLTSLDNQE